MVKVKVNPVSVINDSIKKEMMLFEPLRNKLNDYSTFNFPEAIKLQLEIKRNLPVLTNIEYYCNMVNNGINTDDMNQLKDLLIHKHSKINHSKIDKLEQDVLNYLQKLEQINNFSPDIKQAIESLSNLFPEYKDTIKAQTESELFLSWDNKTRLEFIHGDMISVLSECDRIKRISYFQLDDHLMNVLFDRDETTTCFKGRLSQHRSENKVVTHLENKVCFIFDNQQTKRFKVIETKDNKIHDVYLSDKSLRDNKGMQVLAKIYQEKDKFNVCEVLYLVKEVK